MRIFSRQRRNEPWETIIPTELLLDIKEAELDQELRSVTSYHIRSSEIDLTAKASMASIAGYLQEAADNNARNLGFAVDQLFRIGLTWVLSRLHIRIERYPDWRESIEVETWPSGLNHFFALRDYRIRDKSGRTIGEATSSWMMLDLKTRKPVKPVEKLRIKDICEERAILDSFEKLPVADHYDDKINLEVQRRDLDINRHVNHISYIVWVMEAVPEKLLSGMSLQSMEISFRSETSYPGRVTSSLCQLSCESGLSCIHQLTRSDDKEIAAARTFWVPIDSRSC